MPKVYVAPAPPVASLSRPRPYVEGPTQQDIFGGLLTCRGRSSGWIDPFTLQAFPAGVCSTSVTLS